MSTALLLLSTQLGGMSVLPYYLQQTQHKNRLSRVGISIGSLVVFGYFLPLKLSTDLQSIFFKSDVQNNQYIDPKDKKPGPLRSCLMIYVCVWLYKIIEMTFQKDFYQRCNITNPYQAVLCSLIPGSFIFNPLSVKSFHDKNYNKTWKSRMMRKTFEYTFYALSMGTIVTIARKYTPQQFNKLPSFLRTQSCLLFISAWIGLSNNIMPLIISWIMGSKVYIRFPYRLPIFASGCRDWWTRWSVHVGDALRYTIYYPLVKDKGYNRAFGVFAVFGFNVIMHNWFAMLMEDKPHFKGYFVGMGYMGFATYVEIMLKRKFEVGRNGGGGWIKLINWIWLQITCAVCGNIMIDKYKTVGVRFEDMQGK